MFQCFGKMVKFVKLKTDIFFAHVASHIETDIGNAQKVKCQDGKLRFWNMTWLVWEISFFKIDFLMRESSSQDVANITES